MRGNVLLFLFLVCGQDVRSLRLVELRVPAHVAAGGEALLGCQFELGSDLLYSVKWYKDGREIYRYLPKNPSEQPSMWFRAPGVTVDLSRSSSDVVTLINLQPESAGVYRCEVTGEGPVFPLAFDEKYVTVHVLPKTGPRVTGLKYQYDIGERVSANCTSPGSKPEAIVKWLVNKKPVHSVFLRGPWRRVVQDPLNTIETTMGLRFMVMPGHYKTGVMEITCQATIAPLYHKEKTIILYPPEHNSESELDPEVDLANEPSPQSLIPSLEDDDLSEAEDEGEKGEEEIEEDLHIQEDIVDKFRELKQLLAPETTANTTDYATLTEKSLGVMFVTLLVQVLLL